MSPIEKIKHAFQAQDWSIIQEAYKDLTGQDLASQEPKRKRTKKVATPLKVDEPTPIVPVVERSQETFTSIKANNNLVRPPQKFIGEDGKEHTYCGVEQIDLDKSKINLFEDDLSLETNFIGAPNKPTKTIKRTTRPSYNDSLVEVQCKGCDKYFKVQREFASHFRCDGCMKRR